jgi:hypothetical protein
METLFLPCVASAGQPPPTFVGQPVYSFQERMTKYFLLVLLGLFSVSAHAQMPPPLAPPRPAPGELSAGRRDTLKAMGNLYDRRRHGGTRWIIVGIGFTGAITRGLLAGGTGGNAAGAALSLAVLGGIPAAIGIGKKLRFSEDKENEADRYRSGGALPRSISRRLKAKDFD